MNGASEVVRGLKERGYKVICFSGGFRTATAPASKRLGIDADFSNILHEESGVLTGKVGGDMMFGFSKGDMIVRLQNLFKILLKKLTLLLPVFPLPKYAQMF
jgi:phosphoserine phosphatase